MASAPARSAAHGLPVSVPHLPLCSRPLRPIGLLSFLCTAPSPLPSGQAGAGHLHPDDGRPGELTGAQERQSLRGGWRIHVVRQRRCLQALDGLVPQHGGHPRGVPVAAFDGPLAQLLPVHRGLQQRRGQQRAAPLLQGSHRPHHSTAETLGCSSSTARFPEHLGRTGRVEVRRRVGTTRRPTRWRQERCARGPSEVKHPALPAQGAGRVPLSVCIPPLTGRNSQAKLPSGFSVNRRCPQVSENRLTM